MCIFLKKKFLYILFQNIIIIVKSAVFTKCFEQSTKCHAIFIQYFKHKTCLVYNFSYCFSFLTLSTIYNTYVVLLILCYVSMFPFAISIIVYFLAINRVRFLNKFANRKETKIKTQKYTSIHTHVHRLMDYI